MTCRLLTLIIDRLVPDGPVVIGIDDTIVRRWFLTGSLRFR